MPVSESPAQSQEIEVKLAADADFELPSLGSLQGVAGMSEPVVLELNATYYDTAALDLLQSRITLRHRTGGKDAGWHLKLPGNAFAPRVGPGALHAVVRTAGDTAWGGGLGRTEVTMPLGDELPDELHQIVRGVTRGMVLLPAATIHTRRTVFELYDDAEIPLVEVADDLVTTAAADEVGRVVPPIGAACWRELEVELLAGPEDTVQAAAARLVKAGASRSPSPSKLAAALAAAGRAPLRATSNGTVHTRRTRAQTVVLSGLARYRDALVSADVGLRMGVPESAHASRAAARRLRSALTVFRALFDIAQVDQLLKNLRAMDRVLEPVRNNDVLLARLSSEINEEPVQFAEPAQILLRQALAERNAQAWDRVAEWLEKPKSVRLIHRLDEFIANPPLDASQHGTAGRLLPALVAAAWSRVRKLADMALADPDDAEGLERVRRAAKSVRYAAELAGTALGDDPVVFAAAVEEIQEVLGEHRNALLVGEYLVGLAADPRTTGAAGFLYGRLHTVAEQNVLSAVDDFADAWDRADDGELIGWLR